MNTNRAIAAAVAALWSLLLLPPQLHDWSGADAPGWSRWAFENLGWARLVESLGEGVDTYVLFGAGVAPAAVLLWWALHPSLARLGRTGRALSAGWFLLPGMIVLSYSVGDESHPLHVLWGVDGPWMLLLSAFALLVALVPRTRAVPGRLRLLVGLTIVFAVVGTVLFTYYPHGTIIGFAVQALLLTRVHDAPVREAEVTAAEPVPVASA